VATGKRSKKKLAYAKSQAVNKAEAEWKKRLGTMA
jgi:hypothetical protein